MENRKKSADMLISIIGYIETQLTLTDKEKAKITHEIHKLYLKIMKELYPEL
jgi:hypothetical protein